MSDGANATWHPAFMPNAPTDGLSKPSSVCLGPNSSPTDAEESSRSIPEPSAPTDTPEAQRIEDDEGARPLEQLFPETEETGKDWLEQGETAPSAADRDDLASALDARESVADTITDASAPTEPQSATTASKHFSTISFARTVSHDVNWDADDDDAEWTLPRTDTDPFKFMSASDRTNSFPVVPPVPEATQENLVERQLPSSEAEDLMNEIERESSPVNAVFTHNADATDSVGDTDVATHSSQQHVGADFRAPDVDASDARYEEGVPLISREEASGNGVKDPFSNDNPGEDDFFDQIGAPGDAAAQIPPQVQPLERKSTMQVLNSLATNPLDHVGSGLEDTVEDPREEDDDFWSKQQHHAEDKPEAAPHTKGNGAGDMVGAEAEKKDADLEAKWAAAFGDDEDLLLDDITSTAREVDPAALFEDDDEGFLEDTEDHSQQDAPSVQLPPAMSTTPTAQTTSLNGRYAPSDVITPASSRQPSGQSQCYTSPALLHTQPAPQPAATTPFSPPVGTPPVVHRAVPPRPEPNQALSFADKSKGGYQSPYDLPMEIKPRKRPTIPQQPRATGSPSMPPPPPQSRALRNSGVPPQASPLMGRAASAPVPPPAPGRPGQMSSHGAPAPKPMPQRAQSGEGFFAELPLPSRARPASRTSQKSVPTPPQGSPLVAPHPYAQDSHQGPPPGPPMAPQQYSQPSVAASTQGQQLYSASNSATTVGGLIAPERVSPYAALQSTTLPPPSAPPSASTSRYSPAPASLPASHAPAPPSVASRYSPAPAANRAPGSSYAPVPAAGPPILPHQPRTSSPLAHFEISHDRSRPSSSGQIDGAHHDKRSSSAMFEPRLNRVSSLPPTREVEEENETQGAAHGLSPPAEPHAQASHLSGQTSPPPSLPLAQLNLSPPKRVSSYVPQYQQNLSPQGSDFVPPPRSHTQSPGALYGGRTSMNPVDPIPRPSSVHDPTSPRSTTSGSTHGHMPTPMSVITTAVPPTSSSRPRGFSQNLNLVPPTDGRERDPLQRWKGAPLFSWGVGGTIVTSFPKDVPRYGMNQALPMILRSPGDIKIKNIKDVYPLEERLAKFPGPLKGKSKKKETIAWLTTGIETLENSLPHLTFQTLPTHEDKRSLERVLLWKILRLFIEFDGVLEGSGLVDKAVREIISPGVDGQKSGPYALGSNVPGPVGLQGAVAGQTQMKSDAVDSAAVEQIRSKLLTGNREQVVWDAADKRLWGHALLIANTVSPDLYKKVSQEFVRKEVNYPGHNNEPLAVLYEVLSGNHEECVDELVPVHARAGLQLMATDAGHGLSTDSLAGLDKWRETLGLVLSNRSANDTRALNSLGNLLSGYGRAEAAHICYLFARNATSFGGIDDPQSNFVLVGADHKRQTDQFAKETESLLLSEVYEYGLSLAGGSKEVNCPHLAAYKLQHAMILAEQGHPDKALQYCETLAHSMTAQTRRSPYHHAALEAAVDNLAKRLKQAPKEESNSWIPKPNMNKVSDSVWNRFNKFVAGDEGDGAGNGAPDGAVASGPFARIAGGTPTISRPPSASGGATGMEMFGGSAHVHPGYATANTAPVAPMPLPPPTRAASRYAPVSVQAATPNLYESSPAYTPMGAMGPPSTGRSSGEFSRSSPELTRRSVEFQRPSSGYSSAPMPNTIPSPARSNTDSSGLGISSNSPYLPQSASSGNLAPAAAGDSPANAPQAGGHQPFSPPGYSMNGSLYAPSHGGFDEKPKHVGPETPVAQGYQPPSYGFEPPPMTPFEPTSNEKSEPGEDDTPSGGYEPPSYQPYSYEPPSYEPDPDGSAEDGDASCEGKAEPKPANASDIGQSTLTRTTGEKTKEEKDRENAELFRKAAEEDARRAEAEKQAKTKKGWFSGGWFGGGGGTKKETPEQPKAIKAKLGEENSFVFDPELKRWVNKKAGPDAGPTKTSTPPPPRSVSRSATSTPPPAGPTSAPGPGLPGPPTGRSSAPPRASLTASASIPNLAAVAASQSQPSLTSPPVMQRSVSNTSAASGPPSRPPTSMSNASSIDDLLSAAGSRKSGSKKPRKSGRYVDVMAK